MRIAIFSDYYPPHAGGGVEKVVSHLARGLASRHEDVRVFTLATISAPPFEVEEAVRVFRAGALQLTKAVGVQSAVSPGLFLTALGQLRREPADIIHVHSRFFFSSLVGASLSRMLRLPLVTTLHVGSLEHLPRRHRLPAIAYEQTLGRAIVSASSRVVAVSGHVAEHARRLGAKPGGVSVIENAVDTDEFHPASRRPRRRVRAVFVGRLIENKGPQFLIAAAPAVLAGNPNVEFVFVGDGPLRPRLEEQAKRLGVEARMRFLGLRSDVAEVLRDSDVFVRPSLTEGMSLTVLEAMACGLPVIVTPVGGTPEVVADAVNGCLVPAGNVSALSEALLRLCGDARLRRKLGRSGRALVERQYGWSRVIEANLRVYESALAGPERVPVARAA